MKIKTADEIALLERSGKLLAAILEELVQRVAAGVTGRELADLAGTLITKAGGTPAFVGYGKPPFPAPLCVSVNECVVHGIPTERPFINGDIVGLDIGMIYKGLFTDMARTVAVGTVRERERQLIDATNESLKRALAVVRPGATVGDIGHAVQTYIEKQGFGIVRDLTGHGVGHALHEDPEIPNFGEPHTGQKLVAGMVIAIEPMVTLGNGEVVIADDGWSVITVDRSKAAHVEDTLVVTNDGYTLLTR